MRVLRAIVNNLERIILFSVGVLVSAIVSELLEETLSLSTTALLLTNVLLVVSSIYLLSEHYKRVQALVNKMEVTVEYIGESYQRGSSYAGTIYARLRGLLESAADEILYFSAGQNSGGHPTLEKPVRGEYFGMLEKKVANARGDFKYIIVLQTLEGSLRVCRSRKLTRHCRKLIGLKEELSSDPSISVDVLRLSGPQRHNSFLVIDRRHVVVFLTGTDEQGAIYRSGALFIEDRVGKLAKNFVWYFSSIERLAQPLAPDHIEHWGELSTCP